MEVLSTINDALWGQVLIWALLASGIWFTYLIGGAQITWFGRTAKSLWDSRKNAGDSISGFQAFSTGLAARIGTGNIAGVGVAIYLGGPGAVFWMWVIALLGMASAFAETVLAQVYKTREADGTFRGGPAYYIANGIGSRTMGVVFSLFLMLSYGIIFNMVQTNSMAAVMRANVGEVWWTDHLVAVVMVGLTAVVIFGGVKRVGKFAEAIVPTMAILYLLVAFLVMGLQFDRLPSVLWSIIDGAFTPWSVGAGAVAYGVKNAMMQGIRRGLFSNEAGMGSAPNAAAAANVDHPVEQAMVQMFGVFVDTIIVCTTTATIILLSEQLAPGSGLTGAELTTVSLQEHLGAAGGWIIAIALFFFSFTSLLGNSYYGENAVSFFRDTDGARNTYRIVGLIMITIGVYIDVPVVWVMADISLGCMALINLWAMIKLRKEVVATWKDFKEQDAKGEGYTFSTEKTLGWRSNVWDGED